MIAMVHAIGQFCPVVRVVPVVLCDAPFIECLVRLPDGQLDYVIKEPTSMELTLVPAYGRDYPTRDAVKADWEGGKDFKIATAVSPDNGRYTSIRDLKKFPGASVKIRYNQLQDYVLVDIATGLMSS